MRRLTLYSRPGCGLCEELLEALVPLLEGRAEVEVVDVGEDPALLLEYGSRIPVLADGDTEISGYPLDTPRVCDYLRRRVHE